MDKYTTGFNCVTCGHPVSNKAVLCTFCGDPDAGTKADQAKKEQEKRQKEWEEHEQERCDKIEREWIKQKQERLAEEREWEKQEQERLEEERRVRSAKEKQRQEWIKKHPECHLCKGKGWVFEPGYYEWENGEKVNITHEGIHGCVACGGKGYKTGWWWFGKSYGYKRGDGKRRKNSPTPFDLFF